MGRVISKSASASRVFADVSTTLAVAEATGPDAFADAERYLGEVVAQAAEIDAQAEENHAVLLRQRAQLRAGNERCNDLVHRVRDEFFNLSGRASRDPVLGLVFPGGAGHYTALRPRQKPIALEMLARALQTHRHRRVPQTEVDRMTAELRAEAADITAVLAQLEPAVVEGRLLQAQRTATARSARRQLAALKRFWLAEGLSEAEIHEVIPSRPQGRRTPRAPDEIADAVAPIDDEESDDPVAWLEANAAK